MSSSDVRARFMAAHQAHQRRRARRAMGYLVASFALLPLELVVNGWVLSVVWRWFVSDVFGIHALSVAEAIGLSLLVGVLTRRYQHTESSGSDDYAARFWGAVAFAVFRIIFVLGIGAIVKGYIG